MRYLIFILFTALTLQTSFAQDSSSVQLLFIHSRSGPEREWWLKLYESATANEIVLAQLSNAIDCVLLSPDGNFVVYGESYSASRANRFGNEDDSHLLRTFVLDLRTQELVLEINAQSAICSAWSPNGQYLLVMEDGVFKIYEMSSAAITLVASLETGRSPVWLSDSTGLLYQNDEGEVMFFDIESHRSHSLSITASAASNQHSATFIPNPVHTKIVYQQGYRDTRETLVYMLDLYSGENTLIAEFEERGINLLQWSPSGRYFVFTDHALHSSGIERIHIYDAHEQRLVRFEADAYPNIEWSPDSEHLALWAIDPDTDEQVLRLWNIATNRVLQLSEYRGFEWSADSQYFVTALNDWSSTLSFLAILGSNGETVYEIPAADVLPQDFQWDKTGQYIAYNTSLDYLYIFSLAEQSSVEINLGCCVYWYQWRS